MTSPWCPRSQTHSGTECVVCGWSCSELTAVAAEASPELLAVDPQVLTAAVGWCAPSEVQR